MRLISPMLLVVLLLSRALFGQPATAVTQPQTFHVKGTITDPTGAVIPTAKIAFESGHLTKTVTTSLTGAYEVDLPVGDYTMTAQVPGFRPYHRPLFRVTAPTSLTFDIALPVAPTCDIQVVGDSGRPATQAEWEAAVDALCTREEFFSVSSADDIPFQLCVRFGKRTLIEDKYVYVRDNVFYDEPVFVAYNLFSLQADKVTFDMKSRILVASGGVVAEDESGKHQADSMTLKIENGRAIRLH